MWLDRVSNQATPSGSPPMMARRPYSPAPRRSAQFARDLSSRPAFESRSSSLSLVSRANNSTGSDSKTTRNSTGSALKPQIAPPTDIEDPLDVLHTLIGSALGKEYVNQEITTKIGVGTRPDNLVEDIDFHGANLGEFAGTKVLSEPEADGLLNEHIVQSAEQYDEDKTKFSDLHRSILACDHVLKSVEESLTSFQKDLGHVSAEIETLQSRSSALNARLENRKAVEKLLGPTVEEICIPPATVTAISDDPVDEDWLNSLAELEKRSKGVNARMNGSDTVPAMADVKPLLGDLLNKAIERVRDYLVNQIREIRSPGINAQIIQRQRLLKYKDIYSFLTRHHPQLAEEIGQAYINTMRWYYLMNFTRYRQALDKLLRYQSDKVDVLGAEQFAQRATKGPGARPALHDIYNIGRRVDVLKALSAPAISSHLAEEDKSMHHIETPFSNFTVALVDNVSAEYSFLSEFFRNFSFSQMSRKFAEIFEPTFALGCSLAKDLVDSTYDCIGVLLCVRLNQRSAFELQRRKVPVADGYINAINMLLWPRFQVIMDLHCASIKQLGTTVSGRSAASKLSFTGTAADASKQSSAPHFLTQRFGQFLYGILAVSYEASDDEPVSSSLGRLRAEYEAFLAKASRGAGSDPTKRAKFLGNNYSLVLTIIADTEGKLAQEQKQHFEELKRNLETRS